MGQALASSLSIALQAREAAALLLFCVANLSRLLANLDPPPFFADRGAPRHHELLPVEVRWRACMHECAQALRIRAQGGDRALMPPHACMHAGAWPSE